MPREFDCGHERAQRADPPQGTHQLHLRPEPLHVLWALRGRLSRGCTGTDARFRAGKLHPRRRDLESRDAREGAAADAVSKVVVGLWSFVVGQTQAKSSERTTNDYRPTTGCCCVMQCIAPNPQTKSPE